MKSKAEYMQTLKTRLGEISGEMEKLIARIDRLTEKTGQGFDAIESVLRSRQSWTKSKLDESAFSADEVWTLVWDSVGDAMKEFDSQATVEIREDYQELAPALKTKESALRAEFAGSKMTGDEVWSEIWSQVWNVAQFIVEKLNVQASAEIKQIDQELEALTAKQSALQQELHEMLISGDKVWNVVKEISQGLG